MKPRYTNKIIDSAYRHPWWIISAIFILTLLFTVPLQNIQFDPAFDLFVSKDNYATIKLQKYFGPEDSREIIYFRASTTEQNILDPKCIIEMHTLISNVKKINGVTAVISISEIVNSIYQLNITSGDFDTTRDIMYAEEWEIDNAMNLLFGYLNGSINVNITNLILQDIGYIKGVIGTIMSEDFTLRNPRARASVAIVFINGSVSINRLMDIATKIRNIVEKFKNKYTIIKTTGIGEIYKDTQTNAIKEFFVLSFIGAGGVCMVMALAYGSIRPVMFAFLVIVLSIIWTFGISSLLSIPLTPISTVIIPVAFGLGIDYSIHMQRSLLWKGASPIRIKKDMMVVSYTIFGAMATTVAGFIVNFVSGIYALIVMSLQISLTIVFSYILAVLLSPVQASLSLKKRGILAMIPKYITGTRYSLLKITGSVRRHPLVVIIIFIMLLVPSIYAAPKVESDFNTEDFLPRYWDSLRTRSTIISEFDGAEYITITYLIEGNMFCNKIYDIINLTVNLASDNIGTVTTDHGVLTEHIGIYLPVVIYSDPELGKYDVNGDGIPDTDYATRCVMLNISTIAKNISYPLSTGTLNDRIRNIMYFNVDGSGAMAIRIFFEIKGTEDAKKLFEETRMDLKILRRLYPDYKINIHSFTFLILKTIDNIRNTEMLSIIFALPLILTILLILFRNPMIATLAVVPVVIVIIFVLATMYLIGESFNVLTVSIIALSFGLGVDYSIYIIREFICVANAKKSASIEKILAIVYLKSGLPIYLSAITTSVGFGILALSNIPLIKSYGYMTVAMIMYSLITALVITPILTGLWYMKRYGMKWS